MNCLYTSQNGIPLKEIIEKLGNKNYDFIESRCKWIDKNGEEQDVFTGACSYKDDILMPLDEDFYSLDDLYDEWEETFSNDKVILTVWEYEELSGEWKGVNTLRQD